MGGGVFIDSGRLTITDSTFTENSAVGGAGAVSFNGRAQDGDGLGGAIFNHSGSVVLTNVTIAGNTAVGGSSAVADGAGVYNYGTGGQVDLTNTIVADNVGGRDFVDNIARGSGQNNLVMTYDPTDGNLTKGLATSADPHLAPLGSYGGPTETMAISAASPAASAGTRNGGARTDQRGLAFASTPSIGAFQAPTSTTITVNSTSDGGTPYGSIDLRQAIALAEFYGGAQTIAFDPTAFSSARTITLTQGQLELSGSGDGTSITIDAPAAGLTINAGGGSRVFQVDAGVAATLSGLTIIGGATDQNGGGVLSYGTLDLTGCTISGNSATEGGGLYTAGPATLADCTILNDSAVVFGGGVFAYGALALIDCTIAGNSVSNGDGGGLTALSDLSLLGCTIDANTADEGGGVFSNGAATFIDSTIAGNSARNGLGGGLLADSYLTLLACTISGNSAQTAGGVYADRGPTIIDSIIVGDQGGDLVGPSASGSHNLIGGTAAAAGLGSLGDYGGPTLTFALLPGSPAIGAGVISNDPQGHPITVDQRGAPRGGAAAPSTSGPSTPRRRSS